MTTYSRQQEISNPKMPLHSSTHLQNAKLESIKNLPVPVPPIRSEPMGRPVAIRRTKLLRLKWWAKIVRRKSKPVLGKEDWLSNPNSIQSNHEGAVS